MKDDGCLMAGLVLSAGCVLAAVLCVAIACGMACNGQPDPWPSWTGKE